MADELALLQAKCRALEEAARQLRRHNTFTDESFDFFLDWLRQSGRAAIAKGITKPEVENQLEFATTKFNELDDDVQEEARAWILQQLGEALAEAKKEVRAQQQVVQGGAQVVQIEDLGLTSAVIQKEPQTFAEFSFRKYQYESWDDLDRIKKCFAECLRGKTSKERRELVVLWSGMGGGKSRTLSELVGLLRAQVHTRTVEDAAENPLILRTEQGEFNIVELRVNFENGTSYIPKAEHGNPSTHNIIDKVVLDRILFHLQGEVTEFTKFSDSRKWGFRLQAAISYIQQVVTEADPDSRNTVVFLLMDGVHNLDKEKPYRPGMEDWYANSAMRELLDLVSATVTSCKYVFAVCSTTVALSVSKAMRDSQTILKCMVSPPTLTEMPEEVTNEVVLANKEGFLEMFKDHPRSMEVLVGNSGPTVRDVFNVAASKIQSMYKDRLDDFSVDTAIVERLLQLCLLGKNVDKLTAVEDGTLDDYLSGGLLKIENGKLKISPVLLLSLRNHVLDKAGAADHILQSWKPFEYSGDQAFETHLASLRCIRSRVMPVTTTLEDLHNGVAWGTQTAETTPKPTDTLQNLALTAVSAKHQVHTRSSERAAPIADSVTRKGPWCVSISESTMPVDPIRVLIVNAKSAPAGDMFCTLQTPDGTRFNEVTQAKSSPDGKNQLELPLAEVKKNATVSVSKGDVYLLITRKTVGDTGKIWLYNTLKEQGVLVGIVDNSNFSTYLGPFAATFAFDDPPTKLATEAYGTQHELTDAELELVNTKLDVCSYKQMQPLAKKTRTFLHTDGAFVEANICEVAMRTQLEVLQNVLKAFQAVTPLNVNNAAGNGAPTMQHRKFSSAPSLPKMQNSVTGNVLWRLLRRVK